MSRLKINLSDRIYDIFNLLSCSSFPDKNYYLLKSGERMNVKKILGDNIKKYRKKAGFTQDEFAEKLDISPKHLSNIEIGQKFISAQLLEKVSEILKVSPSTLFYSTDERSLGDESLSKIDRIIDEYFDSFAKSVKERIREEI